MFYPIFVEHETERVHSIGDAPPLHVERSTVAAPAGTTAIWPISKDGSEARWGRDANSLRAALADGYVKLGKFTPGSERCAVSHLQAGQIRAIESGELQVVGKDKDGSVQVAYAGEQRRTMPGTAWHQISHSASEYGSSLLGKFLPGRRFPFPKSLFAVEDALRFFVNDKPNALVLDFFSGSGTTAHAIMRLNKQDGGRRQCISVTNNEVGADEQGKLRKQGLRPGDSEWEQWGICDYITKPRIRAAITGRTPDGELIEGDYKFTDEFSMADGFEENAAFFTLTYESPLSVRHHRAFERIAPMLWMRAGSTGRIITDLDDRGWDVAEVYAVLEDIDNAEAFFSAMRDADDVRTVFVITDDNAAFQMVCRELPSELDMVRLYESYLQNFEINQGRSV